MRNSVNVGLGAGGAMVETVGNIDSRPSSTDSCKSGSNANDPSNPMSFKDVLVQFAKMSQQQGSSRLSTIPALSPLLQIQYLSAELSIQVNR